jgi:hypothetical protein
MTAFSAISGLMGVMLATSFGITVFSLQAYKNKKEMSTKGINFFIIKAFDCFKYSILMGVLTTFPILP